MFLRFGFMNFQSADDVAGGPHYGRSGRDADLLRHQPKCNYRTRIGLNAQNLAAVLA